MNPADIAPGMQPMIADAVARPMRNESFMGSSWKCICKKVFAPLMTAVSYPNRKPPIPVTAAQKTTKAMFRSRVSCLFMVLGSAG